MRCVELFAGAGGLAMGIHLAGFEPAVVVEWNKGACETIRKNSQNGFPLVEGWDVREGDVRYQEWNYLEGKIDLVAGGPPCQPFSMGGKHQAYDDARDMFPATVDIVRKLQPRAFIIENVKGLTRSTFANYYQYILLQLTFPELKRKPKEDWLDHFRRLQKERTSGNVIIKGLTNNVVTTLVNAADYGVPQKRDRVFIVGFRSDLDVEWSFPKPTHSADALLFDQWVSGQYWERHGVARRHRGPMPEKFQANVRALAQRELFVDTSPWRTVRDALIGLPEPTSRLAKNIPDHQFQDGARAYPGHTGSPLDAPAKTLKAGDHGVPGGENMLVRPDGSVRYFTVREAARIQTFPDGYRFHGSWSETMRQLGNAVPVELARVVASSVAEKLIVSEMNRLAAMTRLKEAVA